MNREFASFREIATPEYQWCSGAEHQEDGRPSSRCPSREPAGFDSVCSETQGRERDIPSLNRRRSMRIPSTSVSTSRLSSLDSGSSPQALIYHLTRASLS